MSALAATAVTEGTHHTVTALREARTAKGRFTVKYRSLANLRCLYYDFPRAFRVSTRSTISGPFRRSGFVTIDSQAATSSASTHPQSATWLADRRCPSRVSFTVQSNPNVALFPGFSNQRDREIEHRRHHTPPTIDQTCRNHQAGRALGYRSVTSVDGTRLRAWDNDGHGVPVLISNGLGTPHHAWPDINDRTDTYRVMTWDHRGLGGSERPSDESRITIDDHTDDLFAVMDSYGVDRAVVIGWSAGVNIAFRGRTARSTADRRRARRRRRPGRNLRSLASPSSGIPAPAGRAGGITSDALPRAGAQPAGRRIARFARAWV